VPVMIELGPGRLGKRAGNLALCLLGGPGGAWWAPELGDG